MSPLSAQSRKSRLLRVFARFGGEGRQTLAFDSLPEPAREGVRRGVDAKIGGDLILVSYQDESHWLLVTSERVISKAPTEVKSLSWSEISDATVDARELRRAAFATPSGKLHLRWLRLLRKDGSVLDLEVESGPSFFALWNVLKVLSRLGSKPS